MKKSIIFMSAVVMLLTACGGKSSSENLTPEEMVRQALNNPNKACVDKHLPKTKAKMAEADKLAKAKNAEGAKKAEGEAVEIFKKEDVAFKSAVDAINAQSARYDETVARKNNIASHPNAAKSNKWAQVSAKVDKTTTVNGKPLSSNIELTATDVDAIPASQKGTNNGVATLDSTGKVPTAQLPSYVDDVVEGYLSGGKFYVEEGHTTEITAESGKIYVDITSGKNITYRWSGTAYVEISKSLALGETAGTAYRGDRGKIAYEHSQAAHARADATKTEDSTTNGNIKINGSEVNVYTHPANHPASMITEDSEHRFVTDEEKAAFAASTVFWVTEDDTAPENAVENALMIQERATA